ncbi:MAG: replication-associated recombination protein A, partial [Actinobacteria bacterium]
KPLYNEIVSNKLKSVIFYGPVGCGKTSLAEVIANTCEANFERLSAVNASVKDVRAIVEQAEKGLQSQRKTILFLDEVHRFNKGQQDVLLPAVESGKIIFIGATTENPFFSINSPLISRSRLYIFKPLTVDDLSILLKRALNDKENGLGENKLKIEEKVLEKVAKAASGDARRALSLLEVLTEQAKSNEEALESILEEILKGPILTYDKKGDQHYDIISAFIKSMRGSDVDAALFWLAKMIESGEDPRFIARRMVIFSSEDIGNADPRALMVAVAAADAVEYVGLPEARINLSQAVIYLALAPKSNSAYKAIEAAIKDVKNFQDALVPKHLQSSGYFSAKKLGKGIGYKYPHSYPGAKVEQEYRPEKLKDRKYYKVIDQGIEKKLAERFKKDNKH